MDADTDVSTSFGVEYEMVDDFLCRRATSKYAVRIVDPNHSTMTSNQKSLLMKNHKPIDIYDLFDQYKNTSVVPCTSKKIFEVCKVSKTHFKIRKSGHYEYVRKSMYRRNPENCHTFETVTIYKQNQKKYLVYKDGICDEFVQIPKFNRIVIPRYTTTFYEETLHINSFRLSTEDIKILSDYTVAKKPYIDQAKQVFQRYYDVVQDKYNSVTYLNSYVSDDVKFPRTYRDETIKNFASQLAFIMYIAENISKFTFSKGLALIEQIGIQTQEFNVEEVCERYSCLIRNMLSDTRTFQFMAIMMKINTFTWTPNSVKRLDVRAVSAYRHILDSIKAIIIYAVLYGDVVPKDGNTTMGNIFFNSSCDQWNSLGVLYSKVIKEGISSGTRCRPYAPDGFIVDGEIFSRRYVQGFYQDMINVFQSGTTNLQKYFLSIPTIEDVRLCLLDNHLISLREIRKDNCDSILSLFEIGDRVKVHPSLKDTVVLNDDTKTDIFKYINDITIAILWMIYFASGGPYRFTELAILKFAGNEKKCIF